MNLQAKKYFNVLRLNEELSGPGLQTLRLIEIEYDEMVQAIQMYEQMMNRMEEHLQTIVDIQKERTSKNTIN